MRTLTSVVALASVAALAAMAVPASAGPVETACTMMNCNPGLPISYQGPPVPPEPPQLCYYPPCLSFGGSVGTEGVTVWYQHGIGLGGGAQVHAGPDGVDFDRQEGITVCHTGVNPDGTIENWCYF